MNFLVEFSKDWADEFNVHGLAILTQAQCEFLRKITPYLTWSFGTNEGWDNEGDFYARDFSFRLIGDKEESTLKMLIDFSDYYGFPRWGHFPDFEEATNQIICSVAEGYEDFSEEAVRTALECFDYGGLDIKEQAMKYYKNIYGRVVD